MPGPFRAFFFNFQKILKMKYTKQEFIHDVAVEATLLRQYATIDERALLNIRTLDSSAMTQCIYGQMTGNCDSKRAIELIDKCAVRYVADSLLTNIKYDGFDRIVKYINGTHVDDLSNYRLTSHNGEVAHFSAIEAYILLPNANNENLIAYIKGETENLYLNF